MFRLKAAIPQAAASLMARRQMQPIRGHFASMFSVKSFYSTAGLEDYQPFRVKSREELIYAIKQAAEYEMSLMNLYLYAAYSMKNDVSEGGTAAQIVKVREWARETLLISHDEMLHLGICNNMLTSLGAMPHFDKPAFPAPHPFFDTPNLQPHQMNGLQKRRQEVFDDVLAKLDEKHPGYHEIFPSNKISEHDKDEYLISVELQRFSIHSLRRFIRAESTEHASADLVREHLQKQREQNVPRGRALDGLTAEAFHYNDVGELYEIIRDGFHYLADEIGEYNLFLGPKSTQVAGGFKKPEMVPMNSIQEIDRAIDTIIWQGEGAPEDPPAWYVDPQQRNHHGTFERIYKEYMEELKKDPNFDPARPVLRNPYVTNVRDRNPHWPQHQVTEPFAAGIMSLFNGCFEVTCTLLHLIFGASHTKEQSRDITNIWQGLIFFPFMTQILSPLGRAIPLVPSGIKDSHGNMRTCGAPFELSGSLPVPNEDLYYPYILFRLEKFQKAAEELEEMGRKDPNIPGEVSDTLVHLALDLKLVKNTLINAFSNPTTPTPNFWGQYTASKKPLSLSKGFLDKETSTTAKEATEAYLKSRVEKANDAGTFKALENPRFMYPQTSLFASQPRGKVTKENARDFIPDPTTGYLPFMPLPFRETQTVDPFDTPLSVLTCKFEGTMQFRLATDPDPPQERKGKSGSTWTLPGEPDFVKGSNSPVVKWGRVSEEYIRKLGFPIKVEITDVQHTTQNGIHSSHDRETAQELLGAELNLIDETIDGKSVPPSFGGRNYIQANVGDESIDPFVLEVSKKFSDGRELRMVKHDLLNPKNPVKQTQNDVDINNKHVWFKRGPLWIANNPRLIAHSGVIDPRSYNYQKALELEKMAAETEDETLKGNYLFRANIIKTLKNPVPDIKMGWLWESQFHISSGDPKWNTNNEYSYVSPDTESILGGEPIKEYDWFIKYYLGAYDSDAFTARVYGELVIPFRQGKKESNSSKKQDQL